MPGIVVDDPGPRVVHDIVVLMAEVSGRRRGDQRLDFADGNLLYFRVNDESPGCYAGAASHDQYGFGSGMKQRGQVTQQALQPHVLRFR